MLTSGASAGSPETPSAASASAAEDTWGGRSVAADLATCTAAVLIGALFLSPELHDSDPLGGPAVVVDVASGLLACGALWWRHRWPLGVALMTMLLGTVSISSTPAGLLALWSLAVHRDARQVMVAAALWVPSVAVFATYSPTTGVVSSLLFVMPLALAATAWGMFVRARRQLWTSLRERALRAEVNQRLHEDKARLAERTRIAREMHDVLAHRISLMALHAGGLEVRPDLPPEQVRETALLLRSTARQALEELRSVIGVLRDADGGSPSAPQPTLADIGRLVQETRDAGTRAELRMEVTDPDSAPAALGRDAYRIVQEALTNVGKHASGTPALVELTGAPGRGLHVSVSNPQPLRTASTPRLPGAGAGLLGLQERVSLAGGTLVHGTDDAGGFVVEADLQW